MRDGSNNILSNKEEAIDYIWQIRGEAAGSIRLTYFASGKMRQFFIVSQAKKPSVCRLSMKRQTEGGLFRAGKMKGMEHWKPGLLSA